MDDLSFIKDAVAHLSTTKSHIELGQLANKAYKEGNNVAYRIFSSAGKIAHKNYLNALKNTMNINKVGAAASPGLAVMDAGMAGWGAGRMLGNTPLMSDPNTTYDKFYTDLFKSFMQK